MFNCLWSRPIFILNFETIHICSHSNIRIGKTKIARFGSTFASKLKNQSRSIIRIFSYLWRKTVFKYLDISPWKNNPKKAISAIKWRLKLMLYLSTLSITGWWMGAVVNSEMHFKQFASRVSKFLKSDVKCTIQNICMEWKPFRKPSIGDGSQIIPGRDFHGTVVSENGLKFLEGEQVIGVRKSLLKRNFVHSRIVKKIKTFNLFFSNIYTGRL